MTPPRSLERAGTLVIRDGIIVYASEGVAALAGRPPPALVGRPFTEFVVPEERDILLERYARRLRGERPPQAYEACLALPDGGRQPVEVHIDVDGGDLLVHLRDVTAREVHRLRLEAVATLGAALQRELAEEVIHARVREELRRLGLASALMAAEDGGVRVVWAAVPEELSRRFREVAGAPLDGYLGARTAFSRRVLADGVAFTADWALEASRFMPAALAAESRAAVEAAALSKAVAVRLDARGPAECYLVVAGDWLRSDDAPAMRLLAAQLTAALDAARTVSDLSRRNADLAALNRVAELVGEATDLGELFGRASEVLRVAAGCEGMGIFVADEASGELACAYSDGAPDGGVVPPALSGAGLLEEAMRARTARVVDAASVGGDVAPRLGFRTLACVPLVARSKAVGMFTTGYSATADEVRGRLDLLSAVGAHLAAAIESHGLLADLRRRVAEVKRRVSDLEAVNALALHIFENAPGDVASLLRDGCRDTTEALACRGAVLFLVRDGALQGAAEWGTGIDPSRLRLSVEGDRLAADAVLRRLSSQTPDVRRDPRSAMYGRSAIPFPAMLAVPLGSRGETRGVLFLADEVGRTFTDAEVALATALAGGLGVGLENAELYADAKRRVEELSLLNEMGRTVAASLDLDRVLREGADAARRLAGATRGHVVLYDPLRSEIRVAGGAGLPAALEGTRAPLEDGTVIARVIADRRAAIVDDVATRPDVGEFYRRAVGGRSFVAAPLLLRGEPLGVLVVDEPKEGRRFTEADVSRLTAVANQLAVAVDNARLFSETRRRAEELGLLHEVGRSLVETLDIQRLLERGIENLARIVDAPHASLALASGDGKAIEVCAVAGTHRHHLGMRLPLEPPDEGSLAALVFQRREPILIEDARGDARVNARLRKDAGGLGYLGLPLVVRDRTIGAIVIMETRAPRLFTPAEVERAAAIANQLAVAVENARLYEDLRRSYAQLERAQQRLIQGERLAALGELSAVVAHEVRNPLGVIFNSLGSLRRLLRPTGDAKLLLDIVGEEADRLNRIVGDLLDFARPSTPDLRPEPLDRVVDEAVLAALAQRPVGIELAREVDPSVPPVPMDARLVRQAVLNLAVNAVQAMPRGGRITVRTRRDGAAAVLEIEDTGAGIAEEVKARIFEPFFTTKASGTGLGLAVVKRIVDGHGGRIAVRSQPGAGTVFALSFPLSAAVVENEPAIG